jgi:uncharacterized protein GlcG (DUF336 family)
MDASQAKALEIGVRLTLVVTDEAGFLIALRRMDGASRVSTEVTPVMAYTAAAFKRSGPELMRLQDAPFFRAWSSLHGGGMFVGEGMYPLMREGEMVGVVACGGGQEEQDRQAAQAGAEAWAGMLATT